MQYEFTVLGPEDIMRIHESSLGVLSEVGLKVFNDKLCAALDKKGLIVDSKQQLVRFPKELVNNAIETAPETFSMYDHKGNEHVIKTGNTYPAVYSGALQVWDWHTGKIRSALVEDVTTCVQLTEAIEELKIGCTVLVPEDSTKPYPELHANCILLQNCTKMNMAVPLNLSDAVFLAEAAAIADQDLPAGTGPTIHYAVSPTNPFQIDPDTCEVFMYAIEKNYPLLISSCPINGATSPMTMAGTTVQTHAEFLGMLTIAQLLNEGIPCIYGGSGGPMDMRTGTLTYGCGERDKMLCANVDIAIHFKLPHWSACGTVDTPYPDFQAGQSKALSFLTRLMKGVTFGIWFGPLLTGKAVSPEQLLLDAEIYRQVVSLLKGMPLDKERFGVDAIKRVGPGGNFMMDEHTVKYMRDENEFYASPLVNHSGEHGRSMVDKAHDQVVEITSTFQSPVPEYIQDDLGKLLDDFSKTV